MFDIDRLLNMKNTLSWSVSGGTLTQSMPSLFASSVSIFVALATDGYTKTTAGQMNTGSTTEE